MMDAHEFPSMDDDDPVVQEFDVFLSKGLAEQLYLFQYPVRPACIPYDEVPHLGARVKPNQQKVELELSINVDSSNYARSKGEQIALNVDGGEGENRVFDSDVMDKQTLTSDPNVRDLAQYALGIFRNHEIHLTPLKSMVQLKPSFTYLDKADNRTKAEAGGGGDAGDAEEEEEAKPVTVRYSRPESEEAKARRMASFEYLNRKQQEERWIDCQFYGLESSLSEREYPKLISSKTEETNEFYMQPAEYMNVLVPAPDLKEEEKPDMPINVLSMTQLKTMSLNDQVRALLINAKLIRFSQLMSLLPTETDPITCLRALQQVALLVQGCWVVKSEVLSPRETFSSHTGIPAEVLNRGRDFVLWRFRQSRFVVRKDMSSIIKLPAEDVKDILEQMSRVRINHGWEFLMEFDREFTDKYPDIVQRQNMLWDAKYQQLSQQFKITKEMEKKFMSSGEPLVPEKAARRRTASRSKSKSMSDSSDADDSTKMDTANHSSNNTNSDVNNGAGDGRQQQTLSKKSPSKKRAATAAIRTETNGAMMEISSTSGSSSSTSNTSVVVPPPPTSSHNSDSPVVDFVSELASFVKEKLHSRYVITLSDLRRLLSVQIGTMSGGKVHNAATLSDELLAHAIQSVGGAKVDNQWPTKDPGETMYALVKTGEKIDEVRTLMFDMFRETSRIKFSSLKSRAESDIETSYNEADLRRILKDYCTAKGNMWYLKGTT